MVKDLNPTFNNDFPATILTTKMDWDDLILAKETKLKIKEIIIWLSHNKTLMKDWDIGKKLKPGYRVLFHGPPGTGKTLTATLLGKQNGQDVYKIDLSAIISKYIGETEKNLGRIFDKAENKDWILLFEETDALFGKRTQIKDTHDRYANQEVAYLLQRIEEYHGLVILASNFISNIEEAFIRRFHTIIYFPMPKSNERLQLWRKAFPKKINLMEDVSLKQLSEKYELSGAAIMNIVQYVCHNAVLKQRLNLSSKEIIEGIQREINKSGLS